MNGIVAKGKRAKSSRKTGAHYGGKRQKCEKPSPPPALRRKPSPSQLPQIPA